MKTWMLFIGVFILSLALTACASTPEADSGKLQVVATTSHLADTVRRVGGEAIEVNGLMGPGIDPHLFVASESDVETLQRADVIIYNGLNLEAQMARIFEQLAERKRVVAVGETLPESRLLSKQGGGQPDPHIWFDVTLWIEVVKAIQTTLSEADPANAAVFEANAANTIAELEALHTYVLEQAARLPTEQRILITAHDAFGYFGNAYGFEVRGLQGISTASEAGAGDVQSLAEYIVEKQVRAIFIESSVPVRNVEALQAAVQSRGWTVEIGGSLFSDAMGTPGTPEGEYLGMVRHNIDTIVSALLGETP